MSEQYPSNAHGQPPKRPQRERQKPVITSVQVRKKSFATRIADRSSTIWRDVLLEVVVPYIRDMFADAFHRGVDQAFYYENPNQSHYRGPRPGGKAPSNMTASGYVVTDYNAQYRDNGPQHYTHTSVDKPFDFSQYSFKEYAAGREILDRLNHAIVTYGHATVNDLYDLLNMSGTMDNTGENYGWQGLESIAGAEIRRVRGGGAYWLDIPDAKPIKK